ncbi:MAG: UDP-N-acetylglucosamine 1-carboxyvinyltransferase, partial [bacterium]|nr:UDP-N-acetylglucosamine 1-carboxyvinyltransferase [bacterium]
TRLIINGGRKLSGTWSLSGNKNEALPLVAASLLFENGLKLKNLPDINDVRILSEITKIAKIHGELPRDLCSKVRGSLLILG